MIITVSGIVMLVNFSLSKKALFPIDVTALSNLIRPLPSITLFDIIFAPKTFVAFGVIISPSIDVYQISLYG